MTAPSNIKAFEYLGRALAWFVMAGRLPIDVIHAGYRIRVDKIEETKHRDDMVWEDLGLDSLKLGE